MRNWIKGGIYSFILAVVYSLSVSVYDLIAHYRFYMDTGFQFFNAMSLIFVYAVPFFIAGASIGALFDVRKLGGWRKLQFNHKTYIIFAWCILIILIYSLFHYTSVSIANEKFIDQNGEGLSIFGLIAKYPDSINWCPSFPEPVVCRLNHNVLYASEITLFIGFLLFIVAFIVGNIGNFIQRKRANIKSKNNSRR